MGWVMEVKKCTGHQSWSFCQPAWPIVTQAGLQTPTFQLRRDQLLPRVDHIIESLYEPWSFSFPRWHFQVPSKVLGVVDWCKLIAEILWRRTCKWQFVEEMLSLHMLEWIDLCLKLPYLLTYWNVFDLEISDYCLMFCCDKGRVGCITQVDEVTGGVSGVASVASVASTLGCKDPVVQRRGGLFSFAKKSYGTHLHTLPHWNVKAKGADDHGPLRLCMTEVFRNTWGDLSTRWDRFSAASVKQERYSCIDLQ